VLDLSDNQLGGTLPEELSSCTSLTRINVAKNGLTGTLPDR
jgi:hypothetical protein